MHGSEITLSDSSESKIQESDAGKGERSFVDNDWSESDSKSEHLSERQFPQIFYSNPQVPLSPLPSSFSRPSQS